MSPCNTLALHLPKCGVWHILIQRMSSCLTAHQFYVFPRIKALLASVELKPSGLLLFFIVMSPQQKKKQKNKNVVLPHVIVDCETSECRLAEVYSIFILHFVLNSDGFVASIYQ